VVPQYDRMGEDATGHPSGRGVSVDEAARALGLSVDAIRKRVQRGTIEHERDRAGRVRIILGSPDDASTLRDKSPDTTGRSFAILAAKEETIEELRDRVRRLERDLDTRNEEIRRRDHLLAAALERIPELEAPRDSEAPSVPPAEASEGSEARSPGGTHAGGADSEATDAQRPRVRSWWRRWFSGNRDSF
jgi:Tfp pilus assembly protein FimV